MMEWLKILLTGGALTGLLGMIGKSIGYRFSRKEKVDVQKVESDIRIDAATIASKKLDDEIKVSQQALEWTAQFAAQLDKANLVIDKLQTEVDRMRSLNENLRENFGKQIDELENSLAQERRNCAEIKEELRKLKSKYE